MRYNRKCPKCESHDVIEVVGTKLNQQHKIPLTKWSVKNAVLDRYICSHCGYTEEFVQLDNSFKKLTYTLSEIPSIFISSLLFNSL